MFLEYYENVSALRWNSKFNCTTILINSKNKILFFLPVKDMKDVVVANFCKEKRLNVVARQPFFLHLFFLLNKINFKFMSHV